MRFSLPLVAGMSAVLLLGAGCGGDMTGWSASGKPPTTPSSLTNTPKPSPQPLVLVTPSGTPSTVPVLPGILPANEIHGKAIHIKTKKGDIVFTLFDDVAPLAVSNMVWLAQHKFYDGLKFHRVEPGFVIQGGDPAGNGTGGPGYRFQDEPVTQDYLDGIVAMANAGANTNGSQFFVMLADNKGLPKNYTIFGKVTAGLSVVHGIAVGDVMEKVTVEDVK